METSNQLQKQEKTLVTFLAAGITKEGNIDTLGIDRVGLNMQLQKYKLSEREPNFGELIKIPLDRRISTMAEKDMRGTVTTIAVALTLAMESLNLKTPMNAIQIVDCAEVIIDGAKEDKIAIEDLMIFLQKLTRGQYGDLYGTMDQSKLLAKFDFFRDDRWAEGIKIRDAQTQEYKEMGGMNIYERENPKDASPFGQHIEYLRSKSRERIDERRSRKQ